MDHRKLFSDANVYSRPVTAGSTVPIQRRHASDTPEPMQFSQLIFGEMLQLVSWRQILAGLNLLETMLYDGPEVLVRWAQINEFIPKHLSRYICDAEDGPRAELRIQQKAFDIVRLLANDGERLKAKRAQRAQGLGIDKSDSLADEPKLTTLPVEDPDRQDNSSENPQAPAIASPSPEPHAQNVMDDVDSAPVQHKSRHSRILSNGRGKKREAPNAEGKFTNFPDLGPQPELTPTRLDNTQYLELPTPSTSSASSRRRSLSGETNDSTSQSGLDTPTADTSSLSHLDGFSRGQPSATRPRQAPGGIIYRLALNDYKEGPINGTTFRYSYKPFEGLNRSDNPERHKMAVMDLSSNVLGYWPPGKPRRKNQLRDSFWQDEDQSFVVGVDFISRSHTYFSIRIHSSWVLKCLRELIKYYPDLGLSLEQPEVSFEYPYRALVHYYGELQAIRQKCPLTSSGLADSSTLYNPSTRHDLDVVMGYLEGRYTSDMEQDLILHIQDPPVTKFETLWLLFKPGETVFSRIKGQVMYFKVLSAARDIDKAGDPTGPWSIVVWGLYFDGYLLKRQARKFKIHEYHGLREIQKLPIKPLKFLTKVDGDRERAIARGKQYFDFICDAPCYRKYSGAVNGDGGDQFHGDVIIDPTTYIKEHTNVKALPGVFEVMFGARDQDELGEVMLGDPPDYGGGPFAALNDRSCTRNSPLEHEDDYLLLPGYIQGYSLRTKSWGAFAVGSFIVESRENRPLQSLVVEDPQALVLLESLAHSEKDLKGTELSPWTGDFIIGKGQGQIVLLHGPSGVGKTMTVECIAHQMERPLLHLTTADLGTKELEAEIQLNKWLFYATKWGAIVLFDEAETFLTERAGGEGQQLQRNALVAVFLRALEYHQGMIFLTTNDPGHLDGAAISRVHLSIQYGTLNKAQRNKIWRNLMNQLGREQETLPPNVPRIKIPDTAMNYVMEERGITDIEKLEVSGRDIRNAFQAAVRLARYESHCDMWNRRGAPRDVSSPRTIPLTEEHFQRALDSKLKLRRNIDSISGDTITKRALEKAQRREIKQEAA